MTHKSMGSSEYPSSSQEALTTSRVKRITQAEEYKAQGNDLYKSKDVRGAIGKYHRALLYVRGVDSNLQNGILQSLAVLGYNGGGGDGGVAGPGSAPAGDLPEELMDRLAAVEQGCLNNLAACILLQDKPNYRRVVTYCNKVLSLSPNNAKALYRRGCSLYHLGSYEEAYDSLKKAQQISKSDLNIQKYMAMAKDKMADISNSQRSMYQGMFNKTSTQSDG